MKPINYKPSDITLPKVSVQVPTDLFIREKMKDAESNTDAPRVLDLFAGAGGFSLGFNAAGFNVVGASEIDKWASDTIRFNFPNKTVLTQDIRTVSEHDFRRLFGDVDVIVGGPPCQGFSVANTKARKFDDPRNTLFREYIRAVKVLSPELVVIENVEGLLKKKNEDGRSYIDIIQDELGELGYYSHYQVLRAQDYGVPQIRPRLIVVGTRREICQPFPSKTHGLELCQNPYVPLWAAISDLPSIEAQEGGQEMEYTEEPKNDLQVLLRAESTCVFNHRAMKHSKRIVNRFAQVEWGGCGADVIGEFGARERNGVGAGKRYDQNNRRNIPTKPSHTLPASFYANFIHPINNRNYTPREGARLQTFPDWYRFQGKPTVVSKKLLAREGRGSEMHLCQYNQIGNAVPPLLAYSIANNLRSHIF